MPTKSWQTMSPKVFKVQIMNPHLFGFFSLNLLEVNVKELLLLQRWGNWLMLSTMGLGQSLFGCLLACLLACLPASM
jgi:hypothetical protein